MDVLKEFQAAIEIEYQKNIEEFEEQNKLPIDERVAKGVSMTNLKVEFELQNLYIVSAKIICENNISKFKEGNSVVLSNGDLKFKMDVFEDSVENFILKPNDWDSQFCYLESLDYPKNNWEISSVHTDIGTKMLRNTASYLERNSDVLNRVESFLNGESINTYGDFSEEEDYLNDSQNSAYFNAINASDFCLIQGPPGTGKTETIAKIAYNLIAKNKKVYISAPTHTAINNCLNAIARSVNVDARIFKIGEKAQNKEVQSNDLIIKLARIKYIDHKNILAKAQISENEYGIAIGATAYSLCYPVTKRLEGWEFDVAIIDEASQLSIPLALTILSRVKKVIFVGDHKQLDPIIPKKTGNEMFAESVFSRLARLYPSEINLLKTSYRLNEDLIKIPNTLFYDNLLQSSELTRKDNTQYNCSYHTEILNSDSHKLILHNVFDANGRSPHEAKLVAELVSDLLQNSVNIKDIGIMSPYRAQVREMKKEVNKILPKGIVKPFESLFVDTVDSMQGQERDYIIYSFANSHPLESMRRLDFFYSPNRLNVAITRAIKKCFVISNYKVFDIIHEELTDCDEYEEIKESLDIFTSYYSLSSKIEINQVDETDW
jgi:DNA replication ATP-dependent helicase Dna2